MFCINCGKEIEAEISFCPHCGYEQHSENNSGEEWYCIIGNVRRGPCKVDEIILEVKNGNITRESLVWKKGTDNWIPAGQSPLSYIFKSTVPTMPSNAVDNRFVWALATVPILVSWFAEELFGVPVLASIVAIVLNIVFISLDVKTLEKSEIHAESWLWLGIVLVPLYLFMRASKTNKQYGYAITWCLMFLVDLLI